MQGRQKRSEARCKIDERPARDVVDGQLPFFLGKEHVWLVAFGAFLELGFSKPVNFQELAAEHGARLARQERRMLLEGGRTMPDVARFVAVVCGAIETVEDSAVMWVI